MDSETLERITNQVNNFLEKGDLFSEEECEKAYQFEVEPGDRVKVYWNDEFFDGEPEVGYAMKIPGANYEYLGNLVLHFPRIYGEKGEVIESYIHLVELCNLQYFDRMEVEKLKI